MKGVLSQSKSDSVNTAECVKQNWIHKFTGHSCNHIQLQYYQLAHLIDKVHAKILNFLTMYYMHHPKSTTDQLYLPRRLIEMQL